MTKKAAGFLAGLRGIEERQGVQRQATTPPLSVTPPGAIVPQSSASRQASREGRVAITQWVDPVVRKQLAGIALDTDKKQNVLVAEALNLLFELYGKPPIARP